MALVTVLGTEGSTYSKTGGQMLVAQNGDFVGMLSGGCLEVDLAARAVTIMNNNKAEVVTYDLRDDDDVFGLGVGCEGLLRILIQPLTPDKAYEPFAEILKKLDVDAFADFKLANGTEDLGVVRIWAPPKVLLLGAGRDVDPLARIAIELGMEVSVSDHRPAEIERVQKIQGLKAVCVEACSVTDPFELDRFDAVIVMSHNIDADRHYLCALADSSVAYVGLLGPPHRRNRLLSEIGDDAASLVGRLHGPVGKRIGGRGPGAIALEIAAELQAQFSSPNQS